MIIWVGVYQVVEGNLSLGQLIAFRIIAGYDRANTTVVELVARISTSRDIYGAIVDIVDQIPEAGEEEYSQIALPTVKGNKYLTV